MFQADLWGILTLAAIAMCWSLAVVLYRVGSSGSVARKLALLLFVEGMTLGTSDSVMYLTTSPADLYGRYPEFFNWQMIVHTLGDCAMLALYPTFLTAALQTKMTRPFESGRIRFGLAAIATALFVVIQVSPLRISGSLLYAALALLFAFALVASVDAWRGAVGEARVRAGVFALAFGIRDLCWGFLYGNAVWELLAGTYQAIPDPVAPRFMAYTLGTLISVPLIAYGILRSQLFDIDLRIRWTIKQSTLAAAVVAIIFVISEGANQFLSAEFGAFAGLIAAAIVVFFLAPLQRFADRVAGAAMPNTHDTPEYAAFRKLKVYEAAVSEALQGGAVSDKERALLNRLRDTLGVLPADAEALEHDLRVRATGV